MGARMQAVTGTPLVLPHRGTGAEDEGHPSASPSSGPEPTRTGTVRQHPACPAPRHMACACRLRPPASLVSPRPTQFSPDQEYALGETGNSLEPDTSWPGPRSAL